MLRIDARPPSCDVRKKQVKAAVKIIILVASDKSSILILYFKYLNKNCIEILRCNEKCC
jgi:hypothetical protein